MTRRTFTLFDPALVKPAVVDSFRKLDPRVQWRNPVMFVVYVGSLLTTALFVQALLSHGEAAPGCWRRPKFDPPLKVLPTEI
jgi:K+-transporting ATPase ATPase B chain